MARRLLVSLDGLNRLFQGETGSAALQLLPAALPYVAGLKERRRRVTKQHQRGQVMLPSFSPRSLTLPHASLVVPSLGGMALRRSW